MALGGENSVPLQSMFPERRAVTAMALGLSVLALGWRLPLPGLDLGKLYSYSPSGDVAARFSIFALGLLPLFTVLAYAELARLAIPPFARWQRASARNASRWFVVLSVLSLMLAALQGYGVLEGLALADVLRSDAAGIPVAGLATFVASAALMIWLADLLGDASIGGGFWALMALMFLADVPGLASGLAVQTQVGELSAGQLLLVGLCLAAGVTLAVFAHLLLSHNGHEDNMAKVSILLWPPYLASVLAGYAIKVLPTDTPAWPFISPTFLETAHTGLVLVFIPVLVLAGAALSWQPARRLPALVVLAIAVIQIILCMGAFVLPVALGLPQMLFGGELLLAATVLIGLRTSSGVRRQAS